MYADCCQIGKKRNCLYNFSAMTDTTINAKECVPTGDANSTSTKILSPPPKKYFDNQSVKNFVKSKLGKFKINHGKDNNNISIITDSPSKRIKREHNLDPNCSKC